MWKNEFGLPVYWDQRVTGRPGQTRGSSITGNTSTSEMSDIHAGVAGF